MEQRTKPGPALRVNEHRPLTPPELAALRLAAALAAVAGYLVLLLVLLLLLLVLLFDLALVLGGTRIGMARWAAAIAQRHGECLTAILKALRPGRSREFEVRLSEAEAPGLYALLRKLSAGMGLPTPTEVWLMPGTEAAILLAGPRRKRPDRVLLGMDLLAGLTVEQLEAILAHELAHAHLIDRGMDRLLGQGTSRLFAATAAVTGQIGDAASRSVLAAMLAGMLRPMAVLVLRMQRAYSRQDEFAADAQAAGLTSPRLMQRSLVTVIWLQAAAGAVGTDRRFSQWRAPGAYFAWLRRQLQEFPEEERRRRIEEFARRDVATSFDTHPALLERLGVLGEFDLGELCAGTSGSSCEALLANADATADRLHTQLEAHLSAQEADDERDLLRAYGKLGPGQKLKEQKISHGIGIALLVLVSILCLVGVAISEDPVARGVVATAAVLVWIIAGIIFWFERRRGAAYAPAVWPAYRAFIDSQEREFPDDLDAIPLPAELPRGRRELREYYRRHCREASLRGDVPMLAKLLPEALKLDRTGYEVLVGALLCATRLHNEELMGIALQTLVEQHYRAPSLSGYLGWGFAQGQMWEQAELFLSDAVRREPDAPFLLALQGAVRLQRGKGLGAITALVKASALAPDDPEIAYIYARALVNAGRLDEANEQAERHRDMGGKETDQEWLRLRLAMAREDREAALRHAARLQELEPNGQACVQLGQVFGELPTSELSLEFYRAALGFGHYPQAHLALAADAAQSGDSAAARAHVAEALDLFRTPGEGGASALAMFEASSGLLCSLAPLREGMTTWFCRAAFPDDAEALGGIAGCEFAVVASDRNEAETLAAELLALLRPEKPPAPITNWRKAPAEQQPIGPVHIGVCGVSWLGKDDVLPQKGPRRN